MWPTKRASDLWPMLPILLGEGATFALHYGLYLCWVGEYSSAKCVRHGVRTETSFL